MRLTKSDLRRLEADGATLGPPVRLPGTDAPTKARARPRHEHGRMNKLEAAYARDVLAMRKAAGEVYDYFYDCFKLRLADKTFYSPDFLVILADGTVELHEVKGFMEDDAAVKLKVAADKYPFFAFRLCRREAGRWVIVEVRTT